MQVAALPKEVGIQVEAICIKRGKSAEEQLGEDDYG